MNILKLLPHSEYKSDTISTSGFALKYNKLRYNFLDIKNQFHCLITELQVIRKRNLFNFLERKDHLNSKTIN